MLAIPATQRCQVQANHVPMPCLALEASNLNKTCAPRIKTLAARKMAAQTLGNDSLQSDCSDQAGAVGSLISGISELDQSGLLYRILLSLNTREQSDSGYVLGLCVIPWRSQFLCA